MSELNILPDGYRLTELGPLPQEWRVVRLGEVFDIQQGKSLSPKSRNGSRKRPFLRTANVFWGYIDVASVDEMHFEEAEEKRLALQPYDLLVCEGGDIGRTAIWEGQLPLCLYQNHLHRLRASRSDVSPVFYMYWMQAAWKLLNLYGGEGNKTTIPNLSRSRLASFAIPLPPLAEQRAIAHVLRTVQQAREATERVIAALRDLKKSLMRHLFTYGPVAVGTRHAVSQRDTEIGPLPEHWQVVRLGEVVQLVRNGLTTKQEKMPPGVPVTRIETIADAKIDSERVGYIRQLDLNSIEHYRLKESDILFSHINSEQHLGKTAIYEGYPPLLIHGMNLLLIRVKHDACVAHFLNYLFNYFRKEGTFVALAARAVGQSSINQGKLKSLPIPFPPLAEQQEIARILQSVDRRIQAEEAKVRALSDLFQTLLHDLMTALRRLPPDFIAQFAEEVPHEI
jgi:type I restriction enzyme S subunit